MWYRDLEISAISAAAAVAPAAIVLLGRTSAESMAC